MGKRTSATKALQQAYMKQRGKKERQILLTRYVQQQMRIKIACHQRCNVEQREREKRKR